MSADGQAPIIIKKIKKGGGDGHHGGAWKVAYADFVTAMMAFFLLMWLLNATTEKQRKGIADYFSPTIPVNRVSGGGDGSFGGDSVFSEETLSQSGTGGLPAVPNVNSASSGGSGSDGEKEAETEALEAVEEMLLGRSGESMVSPETQRHIMTRVTDEGLIIDIFDLEGDPLFEPDSDIPTNITTQIIAMVARVFSLVANDVAVEGHVATQPLVVAENTAWNVSGARATRVRRMLEAALLDPERIHRVTGHADREPHDQNVMSPRNNRIELILLRNQ